MSYKIESPLPVIEGGTGVQSNTAYAVLCGGTTSTNPIQSIASVGTSGYVLTSNGAGALPTFQNVGVDALTFATDTIGTATPFAGLINVVTGNASLNAGSSVLFTASGSTVQLDVTDALSNTIIGSGAGNLTLSGDNNTILGKTSGQDLTSGTDNALFGFDAGASLTTGSHNVLLGSQAGSSYTSSESSNIIINASGTIADAHTLRIGSATGSGIGELNKAFISGIDGINVGSVATVVTESGNQLGTAVITAGTGITITPGANLITISADGAHVLETLTGDTGGAISPSIGNINIIAGTSSLNSGSSVSFSGSLSNIQLNVSDTRLNTIIGRFSGNATLSGVDNTVLGETCAPNLTSGNVNTIIGSGAGNITTGSYNVLLGYTTGSSYTTSESSNIVISSIGTVGESNCLRIGKATGTGTQELSKAFICGIDGVNVGSTATVVTEASNQLGTAVITAGTGITITPGANLITIATTALTSAITSISGDTGGAQTGPGITFAGGTTGLSFGGSANTITTTFAGITANGGTVSLATDATVSALNIGTGGGVKTLILGSTNTTSVSTLQSGTAGISITATNGPITANSGTGTIGISTDAAATTINIGNGAGFKFVTVGSTNTTSATLIQAGTGTMAIQTINSALGITSGTGALSISTDSVATTVNIATGNAVKTVTIGSTNTTSSLSLKYGTGNFSLASATGTTISVKAAGQVTMPFQPAFLVYLNTTITNVTGDGTFYSIVFDTTKYDIGSNINLAGPPTTFTAPVTGKYHFVIGVGYTGLTTSDTDGRIALVTTAQTYQLHRSNYGAVQTSGIIIQGASLYTSMTAGDTAYVQTYVAGSTKTVNMFGDVNGLTFFSGVLVV